MNIPEVVKRCVGPGLKPEEEPCPTRWHKMPAEGDAAHYNGIINWRCADCFAKHREKVRAKNA